MRALGGSRRQMHRLGPHRGRRRSVSSPRSSAWPPASASASLLAWLFGNVGGGALCRRRRPRRRGDQRVRGRHRWSRSSPRCCRRCGPRGSRRSRRCRRSATPDRPLTKLTVSGALIGAAGGTLLGLGLAGRAATPVADPRRRAGLLHRRRAADAAAGPPGRGAARPAVLLVGAGQAGPAQLRPQPAPHRDHRRRADGRPGADHRGQRHPHLGHEEPAPHGRPPGDRRPHHRRRPGGATPATFDPAVMDTARAVPGVAAPPPSTGLAQVNGNGQGHRRGADLAAYAAMFRLSGVRHARVQRAERGRPRHRQRQQAAPQGRRR